MRRSYDVVVIGAGIIGLSVAYYLKRKGCAKVLVLEKEDTWINGSTPRANGGFRQQFSTPINIRMSQLSLPVFENFGEVFDTDIAFRQRGYLFVTASEAGRRGLLENLKIQRQHQVPVDWLEPSQIKELAPFVKTDDLLGGNFCPKDGYADSYSIAAGFGAGALRLGAEMELLQPVVEVMRSGSRVTGVRTPTQAVETRRVVNAAGPAAAHVSSLLGIDLPVKPVRRMLVMTEDFAEIPEAIPMTIDIDTGFIMRKESGRVLMGWSDPDEPPGFNLAFDPSIIDVVAEKAVRRVPSLERARINPRKSWAGLYAETPDHHCVLGEVDESGFFLANGFSGHGMMHSPAVGMVLADLVLEGSTSLLDVHPLRFSRFAEGDLIRETVVI